MSQFDAFENEFNHLLNAITRKAQHLGTTFGAGAERLKRLDDAERDAREARAVLGRMESSIKAADGPAKQRMLNRHRNYANDLATLERQLREQRATTGAGGGAGAWGAAANTSLNVDPVAADFEGAKRNQRNQVLATQDLADETRERLRHAIEVSAVSEQVGSATLEELHSQRQQLESASQQIYIIDDNMSKSRRILTGMARRAATSKIVLVIIIVLLLGAIGLIIYLRWGR